MDKFNLNKINNKDVSFRERIESLRGSISKESGEEFSRYLKKSREEWEEREKKQFPNQ